MVFVWLKRFTVFMEVSLMYHLHNTFMLNFIRKFTQFTLRIDLQLFKRLVLISFQTVTLECLIEGGWDKRPRLGNFSKLNKQGEGCWKK